MHHEHKEGGHVSVNGGLEGKLVDSKLLIEAWRVWKENTIHLLVRGTCLSTFRH